MSSPFQKQFSAKNPLPRKKKKDPNLNSEDTESDLPESEFPGDDISSYNPKGAVVTERLEENYPNLKKKLK